MRETIVLSTNNNGKLKLQQSEKNEMVFVLRTEQNDINSVSECISNISAGDFVMLINYHNYIKENDIQCDFINPHGKNKR